MKLELPERLYSLQDLQAVLAEIKAHQDLEDHVKIKSQVTHRAGSYPETSLSPNAVVLIHQAQSQNASLEALIQALESLAETAPEAHITLAALAPEPVKASLTSWLRREIQPNLLVEFSFSSLILGGMIMRLGSHIFDWSFRRKLLAAQDKFAEVMHRV